MGDNDFPAIMGDPTNIKEFLNQYLPTVPKTQKPEGYFREELSGTKSYSQSGTDIPSFKIGQSYQQGEGGPVMDSMVAGSPSFNVIPDIDDPIVDKWIQQEKQKPGYVQPQIPSGQDLQRRLNNFRQRYSHLFAANQGPSTPVKYDESMGGIVPNQGAGRPVNIRYKGFPAA